MRYCTKCVQPDTRPGIVFGEDGVCGACMYEEEKKSINWDARWRELQGIAEWAKETSRTGYDCVVGVSGGKDSTFQALTARDRLGLRVLLVNSEPEGITEIGQKNIENLKQMGFDCVSIRPNTRVMRQLVKKCFYEYGNPAKITEYSLTASAYIASQALKIPLVIQGENDALTLGVKNIGLPADGNALNYNKVETQMTPLQEFIGGKITERDLFMFKYDGEKMAKDGHKAVWLQYYTKEWSQSHNAEFSIRHGLTIRPKEFDTADIGTYCPYYQLDSDIWPMNMMLKYVKFGFGQATDHACYDIRAGILTREEAINLVKEYDGKCHSRYVKGFCDYIVITLDEFWRVAESFRGPMWEKDDHGKWHMPDAIWNKEQGLGGFDSF